MTVRWGTRDVTGLRGQGGDESRDWSAGDKVGDGVLRQGRAAAAGSLLEGDEVGGCVMRWGDA